jgi:hypothetical protein
MQNKNQSKQFHWLSIKRAIGVFIYIADILWNDFKIDKRCVLIVNFSVSTNSLFIRNAFFIYRTAMRLVHGFRFFYRLMCLSFS